MEPWSNKEIKKLGEFAKQHGLPDEIEPELIKLIQQFAKMSKEFSELNEEQKNKNREKFYESQKIFFEVGATVADIFIKKDDGAEGPVANAEMQIDEQQASASAQEAVVIVRTIPAQQVNNDLQWVPYVQYRKILQSVLELESGNLTDRTMSEIFHAIEVSKTKARGIEYDYAGAEQPIMAIVHSKFDTVTKGIWEFQLGSGESTIETLERFLEQRANMIHEELGPPPAPVSEASMRRKQTVCIYCKGATHTIYKCSAGFVSLTIAAKKQFLHREERCENCFMRHPNDICIGGSCWTCKVQHNSMLCPKNPKNL